MKKTLKKIFNIVWHVLVAVAFCGFIVLPFLHNAIDKTFGQWLWYPCLVIFLVYSFIPNKKMKEQSKYVQISSSGGILQLLFIISGIFVINYYDTGYNWYWFAFALIALSIPIGCVTVKVWAESKNTYSTEQVKAANVRLGKYIMFYWLLDLFYMACFNQWLVLQFVFGGVAMLIVFYSLTVAFLSEIKTNKWLLLTDFLLGIGITVYLIYIIPNSSLQEILIPIISAVYGGLLTLVGVAWTIKYTKNSSEKRENAKETNARKSLIVILRETYNACLEQISWLDDTQIRGSVATKVDGNTPIKDEPFIKHLQELPFISSEKVIYSIENGLLSESELEAYIKIKNEYRHYIASRIIFFDIEQAKNPDQLAMKYKIVASKAALLSMINEQISNLG